MGRKLHFFLAATTALAAVSQAALAQERSDGGDLFSSFGDPGFSAVATGAGDNLGDHQATQDLDMGGFYIQNLADPVDPSDAVTLQYFQSNGDDLGDHIATEALKMNNFEVYQLPAPTTPTSAVNRAYLETAVAGAKDNLGDHKATTNLNLSGFRILNLADPTLGTDAVPYSFLQSYVASNGDDLGDHTATEDLDLAGNKIIGLGAPSANDDAATKLYVDDATVGVQDQIDDLKAIQIIAGTGLSGGGDLTADVTLNVDTTYGDGRWVTKTGNVSISGTKTFTGTVVVGTPTSNSHAANKGYVDTAAADAAAAAAGALTAGDGLTRTGNEFAVDPTVVRTTRTISAGTGLTGGGALGANRHAVFRHRLG